MLDRLLCLQNGLNETWVLSKKASDHSRFSALAHNRANGPGHERAHTFNGSLHFKFKGTHHIQRTSASNPLCA
jgi:hypothetical protein